LVAAKAVEANTSADARTRVFDTVAKFMTAPFSFPNTSGSGWGGPAHDWRDKTF
jgi:hypothetical protein